MNPERIRSPAKGEFYVSASRKFSPGSYSVDCFKADKQQVYCGSCWKCGLSVKPGIVKNALKLIVINWFKWSACRRLITTANALFPCRILHKSRWRTDFIKKPVSVETTLSTLIRFTP